MIDIAYRLCNVLCIIFIHSHITQHSYIRKLCSVQYSNECTSATKFTLIFSVMRWMCSNIKLGVAIKLKSPLG